MSHNRSEELLQKIHLEEHQKNSVIYNGKVSLSSAGGMGVIADSSPQPTADLDGRDGWLFAKTLADASKFNYYFYSEGNQPVTLGELVSLCANVSIDNYQGGSSIPFFTVYTKMTGVGDAGAWYHSRVTYTLDAGELILIGEDIEMYSINKQQSHHQNKRAVSFNTKILTGDCADAEEIYTIAIQSDSGAPASTQILVSNLGFSINKNGQVINRRILLN